MGDRLKQALACLVFFSRPVLEAEASPAQTQAALRLGEGCVGQSALWEAKFSLS